MLLSPRSFRFALGLLSLLVACGDSDGDGSTATRNNQNQGGAGQGGGAVGAGQGGAGGGGQSGGGQGGAAGASGAAGAGGIAARVCGKGAPCSDGATCSLDYNEGHVECVCKGQTFSDCTSGGAAAPPSADSSARCDLDYCTEQTQFGGCEIKDGACSYGIECNSPQGPTVTGSCPAP